MSEKLDKYLRPNGEQVPLPPYESSFIDEVIQPLYEVIAAVCLKFLANLLW